MIARIRNWDVALVRMATALVGQPFAWGQTDCASLFRRTSAAMYGVEVFPWLGQWKTERGAWRKLVEWGSMAKALTHAGAALVALSEAQSGDILLSPVRDEPHERFGMAAVMVSGKLCWVDVEHGVRCERVPLDVLGEATLWRLPAAVSLPASGVAHG